MYKTGKGGRSEGGSRRERERENILNTAVLKLLEKVTP